MREVLQATARVFCEGGRAALESWRLMSPLRSPCSRSNRDCRSASSSCVSIAVGSPTAATVCLGGDEIMQIVSGRKTSR